MLPRLETQAADEGDFVVGEAKLRRGESRRGEFAVIVHIGVIDAAPQSDEGAQAPTVARPEIAENVVLSADREEAAGIGGIESLAVFQRRPDACCGKFQFVVLINAAEIIRMVQAAL